MFLKNNDNELTKSKINHNCRFAGEGNEEISKGVNYTDSPHATSTLTISVTREDNLKEYRFVRLLVQSRARSKDEFSCEEKILAKTIVGGAACRPLRAEEYSIKDSSLTI